MIKHSIYIFIFVLFNFSIAVFAEVIVLKSGKTVEGDIIEKTDKYIKVNIANIPITYYLSDINSIEGEPLQFSENIKAILSEKYDLEQADLYAKEALNYMMKGDLNTAKEKLNLSLECFPNHFGALYTFGAIYLTEGKFDKTIEFSNKILETYPDTPELSDVYYNLSTAYLGKNDLNASIKFSKKAISLTSRHAPAHLNLGIAHIKSGNKEEAIKQHKILTEINPNRANQLLKIIEEETSR
ncbi:MAG: hypothetical protein KKH93_00040 [Candidatus Omnitrophica bacterium]|nr:hypothetical protein [Candidatus Omnitrophota bacterium]MBU2044511.1 hypothetical protein [Candidatus Omnitrophota bacterium]MBU2251687.1 hypothetical protein [Candidatus Omnitrophota bacterium]MBU2473402.1 hypothetical protein [Candidatus Omnitrophota bacterium]